MKEEIKELKEELKELKNKQEKQTDLFKYKFFATNKQIPWFLGGEDLKPTPDIQDTYFNFTQLPDKLQFNFINQFQATIIVNDDSLTFWKIERYKNGVKDKTFYFKTNRVIKYVKNGFELELSLDTYLTYTKNIINNLKGANKLVKVNRGLLTSNLLSDFNNPYHQSYLKALKNIDDNVLNGDDSYSTIKPFRFDGLNVGKASNTYPIYSSGGVIDGGLFNMFKFPKYIDAINFKPQLDGTGGYGSVQKNNDGIYSIHFAKKWFGLQNPTNPKLLLSQSEQEEISKFLNKETAIKSVSSGDGYTSWEEANRNLMSSYFAVFRNINGTIDCYPLIGKLKAKYQVPVYPEGITRFPSASENSQVVHSTIFTGRFYVGYDTVVDGELYNDWESIYNDYIKNVPAWYTAKSYIGIYRGIIPTGSGKNRLQFEMKDVENFNNTAYFDIYNDGNRVKYRFAKPHRILIKLNYEEVLNIDLDNDIDGKATKKFLLSSASTNLIDNYVKLLQPICYGSTEIIPAKYSFLATKTGDELNFSIPFLGSFLDGFYLFLKSGTYNGAVYGLSLGGTLPTKTETYQQQLDIINQQKNAGVASAVGNIFARPLNWLSGGFGASSTVGKIRQDGLLDDFDNMVIDGFGINKLDWMSGDRIGKNSRNFGASIGGVGGFIGDGISIWNTIASSKLARRNIGIGYLTSSSDDLLSAIVQNSFISNVNFKPLDTGIFSVCFKKEFDKPTFDKYVNYFHLYGFNLNEIVPSSYINEVINYVKSENKIGFFQIDKDWCLTNIEELVSLNDNDVRSAVISDLSIGIRMKKYF